MEPEIKRDEFRKAVSDSIEACDEAGNVAVIVIKIFDLHKYNARFGYDGTDEIFREAFEALVDSTKKLSGIYRCGSSTIGIVVNGLKFPHLIGVGLERVLDTVKGPYMFDDQQILLSAIAGASLYPGNGKSADQLLLRAEAALQSCESGAGHYKVYDELQQTEMDRWQVEADLRSAIEDRQLVVNYQPQVRLSDDATAGFEALLRWHHPVYGSISPERFIPLVESGGMMSEVTEWVLLTAFRETIGSLENPGDLTVSINVSPSTLFDPGFPFVIDSAISLWGAVYEHFTLEITESVLMDNFEAAEVVLNRLRDNGARISIDDFGTGYSSLAYFKQLPADELKIDQSFVRHMVKDAEDFKLVEVMIQLAHKFDLTVVAEGIEDRETLDALRGLGCDIAQGYYVSRPMEAEGLKSWLDRNPPNIERGP
jgi:EAL domain-containing protein (putative c-di-GMP-specific phosphodiesterase class I)